MYYSERFFNKRILDEILQEYEWPSTYVLQETNSGSVIIRFPKCKIIISEGFESNMNAYFPNSETGRNDTQASLRIIDAIDIIKPIRELESNFNKPQGLISNLDVEPSLEKVKHGLRNICIMLQTYLLSCISGDFSWVYEYNKKYPDFTL